MYICEVMVRFPLSKIYFLLRNSFPFCQMCCHHRLEEQMCNQVMEVIGSLSRVHQTNDNVINYRQSLDVTPKL
jgi:hypothetical protein